MRLKQFIHRMVGRPSPAPPDAETWLVTLDRITAESVTMAPARRRGPRVLMGPPFSIYGPSFAHDRLLAAALRLRGATILPVYCDAIQQVECNVYGGVWGGDKFPDNCAHCHAQSRTLWRLEPELAHPLSRFMEPGAVKAIDNRMAALGENTWLVCVENGLPLGSWAKDILVNNYVVGDYRLIPDAERLGRAHLRNLMLLHCAYERLLDELKPDVALTNDSYYGMWALMRELCMRRGISAYSYWPAGRERTAFARNDAAMNLDFHAAWPRFSSEPLDDMSRRRTLEWLGGQAEHRDMLLNTSSRQAHYDEDFNPEKLDRAKPVALLAANVIWDLAALNRQVVFSDMIEWISETINWFERHPQYQLVVKPHPAEMHPSIPATKEKVRETLTERGVRIPSNVFLLAPTVRCTVYELLPFVAVGITHTTTVGLEMVVLGTPVVTTGRSPYRGFGFTLDPSTREEYFACLQDALDGRMSKDSGGNQERALYLAVFYQCHYYMKLGLTENEWNKPPKLLVSGARDLLPGRHAPLDYVCDSILNDLPIVGPDRWPPAS